MNHVNQYCRTDPARKSTPIFRTDRQLTEKDSRLDLFDQISPKDKIMKIVKIKINLKKCLLISQICTRVLPTYNVAQRLSLDITFLIKRTHCTSLNIRITYTF